jgi:hypothetical protein
MMWINNPSLSKRESNNPISIKLSHEEIFPFHVLSNFQKIRSRKKGIDYTCLWRTWLAGFRKPGGLQRHETGTDDAFTELKTISMYR